MLSYIVRRLLIMVPTLLAISLIIFVIIQLPPGDYFESYMNQLLSQGENVDMRRIEFLRQQYGFDRPMWEQYLVWVWGMVQGDMGYSFEFELPVNEVVGDRLYLTALVSFATIVFTWVVASTAGATTRSPSSASSAWRRPTSCWRWCCFTSPTSPSAPRSAG